MRGVERFAMFVFYGVFILLIETVIYGNCNNGDRQYRRVEPEYQNHNPAYYNKPKGAQAWTSSASSSVISSGHANAVGSNSYVYNPPPGTNRGASSKTYAISSSQGNFGVNTYPFAPSTGSTSTGSKTFVYIVPPPRPIPKREYHQSNTGRGEWRCNGDRNATFKSCPDPCPGTCRNPQGVELCYAMCVPHGCECNPGYVLSDQGICILYQDCPGALCNGDRNATYKACPEPCPSTCELLGKTRVCARKCKPYGCECNSGYHFNAEGKCVYVQDCPGALCKGDKNATYVECPNPCPKTCDDPKGPEVCTAVCLNHGCQCNEGYYLNRSGKCVLLEDCPGCNGDRNATYSNCPSICPKTCDDPKGPDVCPAVCGDPGCVCNDGYYLNSNGKCVLLEDCPVCYPNASYKECRSACPKTCDDPKGPDACPDICKEPGCECDEGYYLTPCGKCVLLEDCPGCKGDLNATFSECPSVCPKTCDNPKGPDVCLAICDTPGCVCKEGYYLNNDGKCVLLEDCPGCKGDAHAMFSECPSICPKTCEDPKGPDACPAVCGDPGCVCNEGYYLNKDGKCVLLEDCPGCKGDANATFSECPSICPKTCEDPKGPDACAAVCGDPGCVCNEGYYLNSDGKCVLLQDCPGCKGDHNATYKACPNPCPRTCELPSGPEVCNKACLAHGCECNQGYYLNNEGKCVQLQDCPGAKQCTSNETFVFCKAGCPTDYCPENDNRGIIACDQPYPCYSGCVCKGDYLRLSYEDDRCILATECPPVDCTRPNEEWSTCPAACLKESCSDLRSDYECDRRFFYCRPRCVCKPGFYRNDSDMCVPEKECAPLECGNNEMPVECKTICPPQFCNISFTDYFCTNDIKCVPGCDCLPNYLRDDSGICIFNEDCPPPPLQCGYNEIPVECKTICPPQFCNISYTDYFCIDNIKCVPGCDCLPNYLRDDSGICIFNEDCPPPPLQCGYNEIPVECKTICPPQFCNISYTDYFCNDNIKCVPGCDCLPNYLRDDSGICIFNEDCPPPPLQCGYNEIPVECKTICPPQFCNISYTDYFCIDNIKCVPGCDCLPNYLRDDSGICIFNEDCPPPPTLPTCGENETPSACSIQCPPQTCDSIFTTYNCENQTCEPGCDCVDEYLRNSEGVCIPSEECFLEPGCDVPPDCRATCYNPSPDSNKCPAVEPPTENQNGCKCTDGYILSSANGECIKYSECPVSEGCNGDPNAVITECPWSCPSTCHSPQAGSYGKPCPKVGCQCRPGLILTEKNGKCILPEDCPYGNPCGANATFADCSFRCPNQNCPEDDSRAIYACKPGRPCPPGCMCKEYYKRVSSEDDTCVLARDCAPINCTRSNEEYNPCTNSCLAEDCTDIGVGNNCEAYPEECIPRCVCCEGYYRDVNGDCVPKSHCPNQFDVDQKCRSTCAVPNPPYCEYIPPSETNNECNCQRGYILDKEGGECIKIEDCPANQSCNDDANAQVKACPRPCPSTCEAPDAFPCKMKCMDVGCECREGYLFSKDGTCVLPDQCEGGNPCGENATFVPCRYDCPTNFCAVNDSRDVVICENNNCYSGCVCKLNHMRLSVDDPRCILSTDCPPINCTRDCEEYNPCPSPCSSGYCEDVDKGPVTCNTLVLNCKPQCTCIEGYYRHPSTQVCVSAAECRKVNKKLKKKRN